MKACLQIKQMYYSRDYNYPSRFNQQYEKSTSNYINNNQNEYNTQISPNPSKQLWVHLSALAHIVMTLPHDISRQCHRSSTGMPVDVVGCTSLAV